ncbi:MAG: RICIN domain-containing protein, partial [Umezawaea sp.]
STKQGFLWFATMTVAKRAKDADDLRPYTLLSAWAGFVPGVRTTDFLTEENRNPVYGADNLPDPWSNSVVQRVQAAFNPVAAIDLPYWSASGASDANAAFPLPQAVSRYSAGSTISRNITVFNDDFAGTAVGLDWSARLDSPTGTEIASGSTTLTVPLGSRTTHNVSFKAPATGSRVYLVLSTTKSGTTTFRDSVQYFTLGGASSGPAPGNYRVVARHSGKPLAIAGNSTADGAKAVQQSGTPTWTLSSVQGGAAYTLRYTATGKMLDVNGHSTTAGVQLQQWTATGGANQQWQLRPTGDGYYTIVGYESGLLADVNGNSTADGAAVMQQTANGGANQQWQLVPA